MPVYQKKDKNGKAIKDTKGNSWYYRCYYTDMYGKRKQTKSRLYPTKSIASDEEHDFLRKIKTTDKTDLNIYFKHVCDEWLDFKKNKIKITTYYGVEKATKKYIYKYFCNFKLHDIKIQSLQEWKNILIRSNLSVSRTNSIITFLKEILIYSNIYYNFDIKVANYLVKIRDDSPIKNDTSKENYWTYNEYNQFIASVDDSYYSLIFKFLYYTGVRLGELRALNWNDINFTKKTLSITKSMSKESFQKGSVIVSPKTKNSIRTLDLSDNLINELLEHKKEQQKTYGFNDNWYVFGGFQYLAITTLRNKLDKYIKIANVKRITIHGFRHSHVSLLVDIGCDFKDVAERIGDTVKMVQETYYHMFPEKKKIIIERLNNL